MKSKKSFIKVSGIILMTMLLVGCEKTDTEKQKENQTVIYESNSETLESYEIETYPKQMPKFTSKDLKGNTVTENIFAEKDLTVLNIWGTFCNPCIAEIPELAKWAETMPDNVQLIGLICDVESEDDTTQYNLALEIMEKAEADFTQIMANKDFENIINWVTGVPTTLFVDKNGNIVGEPIIDVDIDGYKKFVEDYLNGK